MPFAAPSMNDDEELKAQEKNGGVNISGESTSFATGVPGQEPAGQKKETGSGSKFANIQGYLEANKPQGEQMGQKMTGNIESNANDATQKINTFQSKAPTVNAYDPNEAYNKVTSLTDQDKQAYNQAKAGYKGPQSFDQVDGYGDTQKAVNTAYNQVKNVGNEAGQRQLLKDTYKRNDYSAGQNALDQTIMQNTPGARAGFEGLTQKYSKLNNLFDTASQDVGGKVNNSINQGLANQKAIAEGEVKAKSGLLDPIRERAKVAAESNKQSTDNVYADFQDGDDMIDMETMKLLGLNQGQSIYDLDLSSYLQPDQTPIGIDNVATADERAKYAALTSLIDGTTGQELSADGKTIRPMAFNQKQFDSDYASKKAEADRNAAATTFTGHGDVGGYGSLMGSDASMSVADYLAGKRDPTYNNRFQFSMPSIDMGGRGSSVAATLEEQAAAQEQSKNATFAQIEKFLADNKYNRRITATSSKAPALPTGGAGKYQ